MSTHEQKTFSEHNIREDFPIDQFQLDVRQFNLYQGGRNSRWIGLFYRLRKFKGISGKTITDPTLSRSRRGLDNSPDWRIVLDRKGKPIARRLSG
jgi:hypothetical protein